MTQDKTLREQFREFIDNFECAGLFLVPKIESKPRVYAITNIEKEIADFYEDKIKSVVREMKKELSSFGCEVCPSCKIGGVCVDRKKEESYNQFGDDLLERLGIK